MSRYKRIELLLKNHPHILNLLFDDENRKRGCDYRSQMRSNGEDLIASAGYLSAGEHLLMQAALSIWDGDNKISLEMCIGRLDQRNLESLVGAIAGNQAQIDVRHWWI